jgi:hypothetical protein
LFNTIGKIGFGVASLVWMANLLQDLRGRTPSGLKECNFCNLKPDMGKGRTDQASHGNNLKISMYRENEMHAFSIDYLSMLKEKCGSGGLGAEFETVASSFGLIPAGLKR